ncbi:hypothetical protein P3X46_001465 [Hevea brasiliensis]|uniref:Uncharacterized protein n=1 Tax=Hevea brasiliensis TaxID=3981 RepID=A0ABQ9ND29_HEVBR|nr:uncharacterized protein LOC110637474 [Hevea brasiliensis]KAJ9190241.1 hypothetical protein P3X46_001465 [Hevea brasiliensis]
MKKSDKNISGGDGLQSNLHASKVLVSSSSPMANVCCSIEMEPRTLREGQLTHAREVAADVVQKMEPKEASNVFIEGLRSIPKMKVEEMEENEHQQKHKLLVVDCNEKAEPEMIESPCQCSLDRSNIEMESPEQTIKEPLSAPF